MTVEHDTATGFMHSVRIEYNRRLARRLTGGQPTAAEVMAAVSDELVSAGVFADKSYHFRDCATAEKGRDEDDAATPIKAAAGATSLTALSRSSRRHFSHRHATVDVEPT